MPVVVGRHDDAFRDESIDRRGPCATAWPDFKPLFALTLVCAVVYGAGISAIPVLDRDEARFAQSTLQMIETGNFRQVFYQDRPQADGALGAHWLQAASVGVLSDIAERAIWAYRLPSALGAWIATLFTYLIGRDLFGRREGLVAALFLATTPTLIAEAHLATSDALMLASVTAAHWPLARAYMAGHGAARPGAGLGFLFWTSCILSAVTKGAVGPAVIALTVVALCLIERRISWLFALRPVTAGGAALLAAAAWAWHSGARPEASWLAGALSGDVLPRLYTGFQSDGSPPGTHLLFALGALGPPLPFVVLALIAVTRHWHRAHLRFCVAWAVPAWLAAELMANKLPHYTMPLFPALTLLAAWQLGRAAAEAPAGERMLLCVWGLLAATLSVSVFGYLAVPALEPGIESADIVAVSLINLIGAIAIIVFGAAGRQGAVAAIAVVTVATVATLGAAFTFPRVEPFWITERIVAVIERRGGAGERGIVTYGYAEPSLVFRAGTGTRLFGYTDDAGEVASASASTYVVDEAVRFAFERQSALAGTPRSPDAAVSGFNYSSGRSVTIWLYFE
jgi:4-amino-4-deoxy-L-arabinose transferase-like glycosyltransferase